MARHDAEECCLPWGLWEPCSRSECLFPYPRDSKPTVPCLVPGAGVLSPVGREPSCCFKHCLLETLQSRFQSSCRLFPWI